RYVAEPYFAVFSANSAEVPPMTMDRWYGGHAAVPSERSFSSRKRSIAFGFRMALVSWYRKDLYWFSCPGVVSAYSSICAGRLLPVDFSSQVVSGASCE